MITVLTLLPWVLCALLAINDNYYIVDTGTTAIIAIITNVVFTVLFYFLWFYNKKQKRITVPTLSHRFQITENIKISLSMSKISGFYACFAVFDNVCYFVVFLVHYKNRDAPSFFTWSIIVDAGYAAFYVIVPCLFIAVHQDYLKILLPKHFAKKSNKIMDPGFERDLYFSQLKSQWS
uniref:Uncharacterized protein n=1 Tax=Panagrolaimus sp. JU765 TaxID=591449 RepID=A0AC34R1X4_9BILA